MAEVLVVEDRRIDRKWLAAVLKGEGHGVVETSGVDDALVQLRERPVDLVVTELLTPWLDGRELVNKMRDLPGREATPVVFYTASLADADARKLALSCGVIDVVAGPQDAAAMARTIKEVLGRGALQEGPSEADSSRLRAAADRIAERLARAQATGDGQLAAVVSLAHGMTTEHDPAALLDTLLRQVRDLTQAERGLLHVFADDGRTLRALLHVGFDTPEWPCPAPVPVEAMLVEILMSGRKPLRLSTDDVDAPHVLPSGVCERAVLAVPLATSSRTYGWMLLADRRDAPGFSAHDAESAAALATLGAVACENAWLRERQSAQVFSLERDAKERSQVIDAIRATEERRRSLLNIVHAVMWELDLTTDRITWSPGAEAVLECQRAELPRTGQALLERVHALDRQGVADGFTRAVAEQGPVSCEFRFTWPERPDRIFDSHWRADVEGGMPVRLRGLSMDVTTRRLTDLQARHAEKMDAVAQLAGGVAHDFNNLLTSILGYSGMAADTLSPSSPLAMHLEEIRRAAERAGTLTSHLLTFSRKQVLQPRPTDANALLENTARLVRMLVGENIQLATLPSLEPATILADPRPLEQALLNLAVNAREAMPNGGRLLLESRVEDVAQPILLAQGTVPPGRYAVLTVSDTGRGMPPDVARHLFEPFYTTKEPAHGNGLGLSQVYGAVRQSHGFIQVETAPGVGTTVRIYLPLDESLATEDAEDVAGLPRGSESILVVEDEPAVRALARKMLERSGYRVTDAATPIDAESIFESRESEFDLLLTDVVMPGMAGPDLYERLASRKPSLKVVYMSGYTDNTTVRVPGLDGYLPFTQKPFSASTLVRKVREALDR